MAAIYANELTKAIEEQGWDRKELIFVQDNAPVYTGIIAREALEKLRITTEDWPAMSPDLNPIENFWTILKRRLRNNYSTPPPEKRL